MRILSLIPIFYLLLRTVIKKPLQRKRLLFNRINVVVFTTLFTGFCVNAQVISNPSFEQFTASCPAAQSEFKNKVSDWTVLAHFAAGSPDYFNTCGYNLSGYTPAINPYNGTGFAGIYAEFNNTPAFTDYKEYFTNQLSTPLIAGVTYTFSFYTAHLYGAAPTSFTPAGTTMNDLPVAEQGYLGAVFSTAAPTQSNTGNGSGGNPRYNSIRDDFGSGRVLIPASNTEVYGVASRNNWIKVTLHYKAVGGETHMTIGQFRPGGTSLAANSSAYYLFDNFSGLTVAPAPGGVTNNINYWYRADKNATNTGDATDVTAWTDVWNGTTVSSVGGNNLPKYKQGAVDYFNFNAGVNFTTINETIGTRAVQTIFNANNDLFMVTKEGMTYSGSPNPHFFSIGMDQINTTIDNWDYLGIWPSGNVERRVYSGSTTFPNVTPGFSTTIPSIMYYNFLDRPFSRGLNGAANGTTYNSMGAMGIPLGGHIFGSTRWTGSGSDNGGFIGHIAETIIYGSGNVTVLERRRVDSYLAIKYGLTMARVDTDHYLDAGGNMVWNGAANTTYNNNIFGVAREDIGLFEQKVSKSVNAGTILTVATINDFVNPNDNVARTGFTNDKTYFLLGDNDVTATPLTTMAVNGLTMQRIQRTWLSQRTNTAGALYFEVDLSSYGNAFANGSGVEMIIADDAAFTTNTIRVTGTYTNGKWVFNNNFNLDNNQRYITFARTLSSYCVSGCNPNTYVNSSNPNTIEYDNMVSGFHATIIKESSGVFKTWGEYSANSGNGHNVSPTEITPTNGYNYAGTPLKATMASNSEGSHQSALLTTDGLYVWGIPNVLISNSIKNTRPFQKITIGVGNTNGLPTGVAPADVKMMFGSHGTLAITTCIGDAYVLSFNGTKNGDGTPQNAANNIIWHKVKTSASGNPDLTDVVALRGTSNAMFALTSNGKLYTWGTGTYINSGAAAARPYATEVTVPAGATPKMIGMTQTASGSGQSYYLLATDGKLYAMGNNVTRQLGDGTTTASIVWKEVTATSTISGTTYTLGGNIAWISPNEHDGTGGGQASINILTNNRKQWAWGSNDGRMIGGTATTPQNPTYMSGNSTAVDGLALTDNIIAVETGGHTTINIKEGSNKFGYVGHRAFGSMGDGTSANNNVSTYSYSTAVVAVCAAEVNADCTNPGAFDAAGLPSLTGISDLAGFTGGTTGWPANVNNGHIVIESKNKGFVITRVSSSAAITSPVEGMLIYDIAASCVKLYNGTTWKCLEKDCNPPTN